MKPVETGLAADTVEFSDAVRLRTAAASEDELDLICPYQYQPPIAPLAASRQASRVIEPAEIRRCYGIISARHELTLVEGVGGLLVPIADDWDVRDLIADLGLPAIVVGLASLGGINHTRLTIEALHARQLRVLAVVLNHTKPISSAVEWQQARTTVSLLGELVREPVIGALPYVESTTHHWQSAVDELARDPKLNTLADLICGID
jgi:dethiobiotin synthetase